MSTQPAVEKVVDEALLEALDRLLDAVSALTDLDASGMAQDLRAPIKTVTELIEWNRAHPGWTAADPS